MTPTYYLSPEQFIGVITLFADDYGQLRLMEFAFKGSLRWGGQHPIAEGAWCIDYVLDAGFGVTPCTSSSTTGCCSWAPSTSGVYDTRPPPAAGAGAPDRLPEA